MFLNYIKEFSLKRLLKNSYQTLKINQSVTPIKSVGLLIDESYFDKKEDLINELVTNGIRKDRINVIIFKDKLNANEVFSYPTFNNKHISWNGKFTENVVLNFIQEKFDLLINYYDVEKSSLLLITNKSQASFKVGFSSIDKRCNNLMIATNAENYKVFVFELFKYLKILKKI
jgi:hypothetical protein